jgi:hypothetical protein
MPRSDIIINTFRSIIFTAIVCALLVPAPAGAQGREGGRMGSLGAKFATAPLAIQTVSKRFDLTVEVVVTRRQQAQGLMHRRRLGRDAGMLFIYQPPQHVTMWMKNTLIPLDMLFIAPDGRVVKIAQRTVPMSVESIPSGGRITAVLELNGGTASRLGIAVGDRILHPEFGNVP